MVFMANEPIKAAIAYDFDGTLAPGNMQEHSFIPKLGISKEDFWAEANRIARENDMDEILSYMQLMLEKSKQKNIPIHRDDIVGYGKDIEFFPGVEKYFQRINQYALAKGIELEHHIISSGLRELVAGTRIAANFRNIFASGFKYDVNGIAEWAALAINYTGKTQYLFRINKGIDNAYDNTLINKYVPEDHRPVPFKRMIYIGDGETDVPAMKMLRYQGGYPIAVYNPNAEARAHKASPEQMCRELLKQQRVDYVAAADYREGSLLDKTLKLIIDRIRIDQALQENNNQPYSGLATLNT
jgi:hypothetical protein